MTQPATKVVIVTEEVILKGIIKIIEEIGVRGYTVLSARGKGSHNVRSGGQPSVTAAFTNVKIEAIVSDRARAEQIADAIAAKYFDNYAGIAYLSQIEVLRGEKFKPGSSGGGA
jgi:nitrogen regulatory protein PII